jgi:uncharacterized membrane protein
MQHLPTHRYSNTPLLIAAVGLAAMAAYALSSPRRRAALTAAADSALEAGSRLVTKSADATAAAAGTLHDALDRASDLTNEALSQARKRLPGAGPGSRVRGALQAAEDASGSYRLSTRGVVIAAAAIGAGVYAMQRYGVIGRMREKWEADETGKIVADKTIFIDAPVEQVFDTWANYENFARFMSNVLSVVPIDDNRSHWKVRGPAGFSVEFDSVARKHRPNELAWESEPGSTVQNEGRVTLVPEGSGTRATVHMSYRPPAGALGQAVSSLFGANPKQEFDEDLNRMKQFIEGQRAGTPRPA